MRNSENTVEPKGANCHSNNCKSCQSCNKSDGHGVRPTRDDTLAYLAQQRSH